MKTPLFVTVLVWIALGTLMMAIANELSMVSLVQGAEGFVGAQRPLDAIVQLRPAFTREGPIPEQKGVPLGSGSEDAMVEWRGQPQMTGLGKYLGVNNASEDMTRSGPPAEVGQNPELGAQAKPFQLLADVIPSVAADSREPNTKQTAEHCYNSDFEAQTQKVRSYSQRTNNYKRAGPDSCSAPTHELVGNFYRAPTVPVA